MEQIKRIHPLLATAAVSLTLVSLVGAAAITGLLPTSKGSNPSTAELAQQNENNNASRSTPAPASTPRHIAAPETRNHVVHTAPPTPRPHAQKATPAAEYVARPVAPAVVAMAAPCISCGRVEAVRAIEQPVQTNGVGLAAGAVLGGLLGNQVGNGNGRKLATVAGVIGGTMAGNEVEKRVRSGSTSYEVRVRMEDGSTRSFPYSAAPSFNVGDRVEVNNGQLVMRG